jgi:hypothetical protein
MKITRRMLAVSAIASLAAPGQAPPPATAEEELKMAREQVRRNGEALAKYDVPMTTEPAFRFEA